MNFAFHENRPDGPIGFELGDIIINGDLGSASSASRLPNQSMMLVLSIVQLLDGLRKLLSSNRMVSYEFIGVDCSFRIVFHRQKDGRIALSVDGLQLHIDVSNVIKTDIELSVVEFTKQYDLIRYINSAEAADFEQSLACFRIFSPI